MKLTPDLLRVHHVAAKLTHTKPLPLLKLNTGLPGVLLAAQECIASSLETDPDAFTLEFFILAHASPDPKAIWPRFAVRMLREVCPPNVDCKRVAQGYETGWRDDDPRDCCIFNRTGSAAATLAAAYAAYAAYAASAPYSAAQAAHYACESISPHPWKMMRKIMLEVA